MQNLKQPHESDLSELTGDTPLRENDQNTGTPHPLPPQPRLMRKPIFLLSKLNRSRSKQSEYHAVTAEFRQLLRDLVGLLDKKSDLMNKKRGKLVDFKTHVRHWEHKSSAEIHHAIQKMELIPQKDFILYKTTTGWLIKGNSIKGELVEKALNLIPASRFEQIESLQKLLLGVNTDRDLQPDDPLHRLVVDFFGFYRPSCFISYSWASPDFPSSLDEDTRNQQDIHYLAKDLAQAGVRVYIDKNELSRGDDLERFIGLINSPHMDLVCLMGTPLYKKKFDSPKLTMTDKANKTNQEANQILTRIGTHKKDDGGDNKGVFPVLISGDASDCFPAEINRLLFCKFTVNDYPTTLLSLIFSMYRVDLPYQDKEISELVAKFEAKVRPILAAEVVVPMKKRPVIIFTDPGVDDFAALALALTPDTFDIKAIVACAGNVELDKTVTNALNICYLAQRDDITVIRGSNQPITPQHSFPSDIDAHGDNGLNGLALSQSPNAAFEEDPTEAVLEILRESKKPITLISLAGLTDIANVLIAAKEEDLLNQIAGITMMGGVFSPREANAPKKADKKFKKYGEFNFLCDPDATQQVFEICKDRKADPIPVVLFELGLTHHCRMTDQEINLLKNNKNAVSQEVAKVLSVIPPAYQQRFHNKPSIPVHDIFPVMLLIKESLFEGEWLHIRCQGSEEKFPGKVEIVVDTNQPRVFRITSVNKEAFFRLYADMLGEYVLSADIKSSHNPNSDSDDESKSGPRGDQPDHQGVPQGTNQAGNASVPSNESGAGNGGASGQADSHRKAVNIRADKSTRVVAGVVVRGRLTAADRQLLCDTLGDIEPPADHGNVNITARKHDEYLASVFFDEPDGESTVGQLNQNRK